MLVPIDINKSDADDAADDFGQDLRNLAEVSSIRGCRSKDMGQQMIGCGLQVLKEGCRGNEDHALQIAESIMDEWEEFHARKRGCD